MSNYQSHEPCTACGTMSVDRCYHHIYTRKARPDLANTDWNMMPLCALHHSMIHTIGTRSFAERFINAKNFLLINNWYFCEFSAKWSHD